MTEEIQIQRRSADSFGYVHRRTEYQAPVLRLMKESYGVGQARAHFRALAEMRSKHDLEACWVSPEIQSGLLVEIDLEEVPSYKAPLLVGEKPED